MLKSSKMGDIRTRFAPSPTGFLHIGGLRTALYSYAFTKSQGGKFVLRIEDTDRRRFVPGATEKIYEILKFFGLSWNEGPQVDGPYSPYIQSERVKMGIYKKYAQELVDQGNAYYCFCERKSVEGREEEQNGKKVSLRDENCRNLTKDEIENKLNANEKFAIRLRVPGKGIIDYFDFIIKKQISWEMSKIDEVVLLKSDDFPTYHLAVVVDDALMKVSHVIRGHDWLPSTPVHLLLIKYLGFSLPAIGHLTDILDPEGGKLSKRKGSVSCEEFLAEGYLPEAILNFIMLLGWAPKDNRELFVLEEFVDNFQKGEFQTANPVFNRKKLDWFNGVYIRKKTDEELARLLLGKTSFGGKVFISEGAAETLVRKTIPLVKERIIKLSDYIPLAGFFFEEPEVEKTVFNQTSRLQLLAALEIFERIDDWDKEGLDEAFIETIKKNNWNTGEFFMNLRLVLTGSRFTPPMTESMIILGKQEVVKRLKKIV